MRAQITWLGSIVPCRVLALLPHKSQFAALLDGRFVVLSTRDIRTVEPLLQQHAVLRFRDGTVAACKLPICPRGITACDATSRR